MNCSRVKAGKSSLDLTSPQVMTIINVTPDSFYSASRTRVEDEIKARVVDAIEEGAAILDVGGYSSRPGADHISEEEEFSRVERGLKAIRSVDENIMISIDTFRASVARRCIENYGECIINDISAGALDERMIETVAKLKVPYIAMHMRSNPQHMQSFTDYEDITKEVYDYFSEKITELKQSGVEDIIIDPGFGFAKTTQQNHRLLGDMIRLKDLGYPLLAGVSRKSMIYNVLETTPENALTGTAVLNWQSLMNGASIIRVHDTKEAAQVVKLFNYYTMANG